MNVDQVLVAEDIPTECPDNSFSANFWKKLVVKVGSLKSNTFLGHIRTPEAREKQR